MHLRLALLISLTLLLASCVQAPAPQQAAAPTPEPSMTCTPTGRPPAVTSTPSGAQAAAASVTNTPAVQQPVQPTTAAVAFIIPAPLEIYTDQLAHGWQDWSWDTDRELETTQPVQSGTQSISVTYKKGWAGLYLHVDPPIEVGDYSEICFYINGGKKGNQRVNVVVNQDNSQLYSVTAVANTWTLVSVPLTSLGSPGSISDIVFQDGSGGDQPTFYIDQITLESTGPAPTATPLPGGLALRVDANDSGHPISPYIYGMNFVDEDMAKDLRLPVNRWGGNATTRYNWKIDVSNRAADWFFENIPDDGSSADHFIDKNLRAGADTIMTIPMIGWTPKSQAVSCGFSVSKYGDQQQTDPYNSDCGNGKRPNGSPITKNDPTDTSIAIDPSFVQGWVEYLTGKYGAADQGGVKFYNLDNEPYLWNVNHRDVHPDPVSYDELRDLTYQYAAALKAVDPAAQTLGPAEWGWSGYFFSAKDAAGDGKWWTQPLDRLKHGNQPLIEWYLQQMQAYEQANGVRILDYLDLHYYPQQDGVALSSRVDSKTQALRLRSTRALWDRSYVDESWIDEPVYLIPRMREWVDQYYPGTRLALTEYNWGALNNINGAVTQADILGIFGREGLDLATLWAPPAADEPGAFAFRMYRNYDGQGGAFGDVSVSASSNHEDVISIFAARRSSDRALTLMIVNKGSGAQSTSIALDNFTASGAAQVYRYSKANLDAIERLPDTAASGGRIEMSLPGNSITLIVLGG